MKKLFIFFICAALLAAGSMFLQSCENERNVEFECEKIERVARSSEFEQFMLAVSDYFHTFTNVIKTMPSEEQAYLFENHQNEEVVMQFLEKNNLVESSMRLQENTIPLLNNRDFAELSLNEQQTLFENHATFDVKHFSYFSTATRVSNPCNQAFMSAFERQQTIYVIGLVFCIGTTWFSALCAGTMTVIHISEVNRIEQERQDCLAAH